MTNLMIWIPMQTLTFNNNWPRIEGWRNVLEIDIFQNPNISQEFTSNYIDHTSRNAVEMDV